MTRPRKRRQFWGAASGSMALALILSSVAQAGGTDDAGDAGVSGLVQPEAVQIPGVTRPRRVTRPLDGPIYVTIEGARVVGDPKVSSSLRCSIDVALHNLSAADIAALVVRIEFNSAGQSAGSSLSVFRDALRGRTELDMFNELPTPTCAKLDGTAAVLLCRDADQRDCAARVTYTPGGIVAFR